MDSISKFGNILMMEGVTVFFLLKKTILVLNFDGHVFYGLLF